MKQSVLIKTIFKISHEQQTNYYLNLKNYTLNNYLHTIYRSVSKMKAVSSAFDTTVKMNRYMYMKIITNNEYL